MREFIRGKLAELAIKEQCQEKLHIHHTTCFIAIEIFMQ